MREEQNDSIPQVKEISARVTFRKTRPEFSFVALTDSLGLADTATIDVCNYGTGLLRVVNFSNTLYTQEITDILAAWPSWVNQSITLKAGSVPAVDGGYVWYQKSNGDVCRRNFASFGTETVVKNLANAAAIAPIADRGWALWQRNAGSYEIVSLHGQESSQYAVFGLTSLPRVDVVSLNNKEYFYTMDRDEGRVIEIVHVGNSVSGKDSYGVGKPIIPIDAIDDDYGLKLGWANVIGSKVFVTGHLTRTSDDVPVTMGVYMIGPENFSLGKEMYIHGGAEVRGKVLLVDDKIIMPGAAKYYIADATWLFGYNNTDLSLTTSDIELLALSEAENRSSTLDLSMSSQLTDPLIAPGNEAILDFAQDGSFGLMGVYEVAAVNRDTTEQGKTLQVSGIGKSARRLSQWSPDQGVYVPSQSKVYDRPSKMTKFIRSAGLWEDTDPEDPDSTIKLKDVNKLGVLYSTGRASRGGAMRAKFYYPDDTYFKPYYGVAINYYRETAAKAAERLGVEVTSIEETDYGNNGIVAIYSKTEHTGSTEGVSLNVWSNNVLTKLTSVSHTIAHSTWNWLQIEFIEGEIRVRARLDSSNTWTDLITFMWNQTALPWKRETFGRGAIVVKNVLPSFTAYGLSDNEMTIGLAASHSSLPSTGTILFDDEQITYNAKSTYNQADPTGADIDHNYTIWYNEAVQVGSGFSGNRIPINSDDFSVNYSDHAFQGAALVTLEVFAQPNASGLFSFEPHHTFRISDFDKVTPNLWSPTSGTIEAGWLTHIGNLSFGSWVASTACAIYVSEDASRLVSAGGETYTGPWSHVAIKPALHVSARGANGTSQVSHVKGTAHLYVNKQVEVHLAASFSQEEDLSIEDALKQIVSLAGGTANCKPVVDGVFTFGPSNIHGNSTLDHKNFIATFELPTLTADIGSGIIFRGQAPCTMSNGRPYSTAAGAYYLEVQKSGSTYYLTLFSQAGSPNTFTTLEQVKIRGSNTSGAATANVPAGTVKVSVQDSFISVWLNGRYVHTFYSELYPTGNNVGFVSFQGATLRLHISELDDLLADVVAGVRGNGMSVITEILSDRHILFRDADDGSMYFYKTRTHLGLGPDCIVSISDSTSDDLLTRVRAEGTYISEIVDGDDLLFTHGNIFATINARHANTVSEASIEAQHLIDEAWKNANAKRYTMIPYPIYQPGDADDFLENGSYETRAIRAMAITLGFSGSNFVYDMQADVIPFERS